MPPLPLGQHTPMKLHLCLFLTLLVFTPLVASAADPSPSAAMEPTQHQKRYYFEHRLLPKWTHHSNGAFFADLQAGKLERVRDVAEKIGGAGFAAKIVVENVKEPEGVLLGLAEPAQPVECFFVFVAKVGERCRYFTFEKAEDILGQGIVACIGEWDVDGRHNNFGFSNEKSREAFLKVVAGLLNEPSTSPSAVFRPGAGAAD
jgi:hypothetical protein